MLLEKLTVRLWTFSHFPYYWHVSVIYILHEPLVHRLILWSSITSVPKKSLCYLMLQGWCYRLWDEILLNFKTRLKIARYWLLDIPKFACGTFTTKWMWCYKSYFGEIFSNKYCSESVSLRQGDFYRLKPSITIFPNPQTRICLM